VTWSVERVGGREGWRAGGLEGWKGRKGWKLHDGDRGQKEIESTYKNIAYFTEAGVIGTRNVKVV
jgi:hypothetical protein